MAVIEGTKVRSGRGIVEAINAPVHPKAMQRGYTGLRIGYTLLPIVAGADKFFHALTNWDQYVTPSIALRVGATTTHNLMYAVGVVEIIAGLLVAFAPRIGAFIVSAWLVVICANLLIGQGYYDIVARDAVLCLGAFSLGQLAVGMRDESGI